MITILGWLWRPDTGAAPYSADHVNVWARMIHRNLTIPHRFVVVTDTPEADFDPLVTPIPLWDDWRDVAPNWGKDKVNCYRRLKAYSAEFGELITVPSSKFEVPSSASNIEHRTQNPEPPRFVSVDLDLVVLGNKDSTRQEPFLDPLFDRPEDYLILKRFLQNGTRPKNWCQGSMWMMTAGARRQVWDSFEGQRSADMTNGLIGTDQAWVAFTLPSSEAGWTHQDGVVCWTDLSSNWTRYRQEVPPVKMIFFNCNPKQDELGKPIRPGETAKFPWIADYYHR